MQRVGIFPPSCSKKRAVSGCGSAILLTMEICQLKYFAHVAKLRSFTVASQRLQVAQSALSRHVKALEQELGVELLSRSTHSVTPTEAGLRLLEMGDFVLHYLDQVPEKLRETAAEPAGSVALGLLPAVAYIVTPPLLQRVRKEFPRVSVRVSEGLGSFLWERLLLGQIDVAVMTSGSRIRGLTEMPVVDEEMVLTGLPRLLARFTDPVPLTRLAERPHHQHGGLQESHFGVCARRRHPACLRHGAEQPHGPQSHAAARLRNLDFALHCGPPGAAGRPSCDPANLRTEDDAAPRHGAAGISAGVACARRRRRDPGGGVAAHARVAGRGPSCRSGINDIQLRVSVRGELRASKFVSALRPFATPARGR